jgi:hypothetical protein
VPSVATQALQSVVSRPHEAADRSSWNKPEYRIILTTDFATCIASAIRVLLLAPHTARLSCHAFGVAAEVSAVSPPKPLLVRWWW